MDLLAEDVIVLTTNPGSPIGTESTSEALYAGALLADLILSGSAIMPDSSKKKPIIELTDRQPDDPMLAEAARRIRAVEQKKSKPLKAYAAVETIAYGLRTPLMEALEKRGAVTGRERKILFIPAGTKWMLNADADPDALRASICRQLRTSGPIERAPHVDDRTAAVLSLLSAGGTLKSAVLHDVDDRRELIKRAKAVVKAELKAEDRTRRAVKKAIDAAKDRIGAINAAGMTATTAAVST